MQVTLQNLAYKKPLRKLLLSFALLLCLHIAGYGQAQQPSIMVIPSDALLYDLGCLETIDNQGVATVKRMYQKAFIENASLKFAIAGIQNHFAAVGFPLEDMEQTLKIAQDEGTMNLVDGVAVDAKTALLNTARPDIILELTYSLQGGGMFNALSFELKAIDAYTALVIGSVAKSGIETTTQDITKMMEEQVERNTQNLQTQMKAHFQDLRENGRIISFRVSISDDAAFDLGDECPDNEEYLDDWINDWVAENCLNYKYTVGTKSNVMIRFKQVRIPLKNEKGRPIAASDWARKLRKDIKGCDIRARDISLGLGSAHIKLTDG